jgi:phosphatidylinositol-bisphosphatase
MYTQGNKGGVAMRMKFSPPPTSDIPHPCPTTFTFVNSHLAAFDDMEDKRNTDFHELCTRLRFGSEEGHEDSSIFETDALFWMVSH